MLHVACLNDALFCHPDYLNASTNLSLTAVRAIVGEVLLTSLTLYKLQVGINTLLPTLLYTDRKKVIKM